MITILLAFDSIMFLIVLFVMSIIFIILSAVDEPSPGISGFILMIITVLVILFTNAGQMILEKPITVALYIIGYFIVGCIFSIFIRWPLYLCGLRRQLFAAREKILKQHNLPVLNADGSDVIIGLENKAYKSWASEIYRIGNPSGLSVNCIGKLTPPQYSENKARLLTWAELWPWCAFWVLVRKPIIWIFDELLNLQILKRICQRISNWMFSDFNK